MIPFNDNSSVAVIGYHYVSASLVDSSYPVSTNLNLVHISIDSNNSDSQTKCDRF